MTVATQVIVPESEDTFSMPSSHSLDALEVIFDDRRLLADAGLIQPATLAQHLGLRAVKVWTADDPTSGPPAVQFNYFVDTPTYPNPQQPSSVKTSVWQDTTRRLDSWVFYDGLLQEVQAQRPSPVSGRIIDWTTYDTRGLAIRSIPAATDTTTAGTFATTPPSSPARETRATYDAAGRPTANQSWATNTMLWQTTLAYDGETSAVTPPVGGKTVATVDGHGQLITEQKYTGVSTYDQTTHDYDAAGRVLHTYAPNSITTASTYDMAGRTTQHSDPDAGNITFTYDAAGDVITRSDANGTIWNNYDVLGRQTERRVSISTGTLLARWVYDTTGEKGLLDYSEAFDTNGTRILRTDTIGYDNRNRSTGTTYTVDSRAQWTDNGLAGTYSVTYGYDKANHRTTVNDPNAGGLTASTATVTYNNTGQTTTLADSNYTHVPATTYTNDGHIATRTLSTAIGNFVRGYTWDNATGRLAALSLTDPTSASDQNLTYTYDSSSNVLASSDSVGGERQCYGYDNRQRLTTAYTTTNLAACSGATSGGPAAYNQTYSYDANNRLTAGPAGPTYQYTAPTHPDAPTSIIGSGGTDTYTYDTVGNRTAFNDAGAGNYTYAWDLQGRMTSATKTDPAPNPTFRNSASTNNSTGATTVVGATPTGTRIGDLLIAVVAVAAPGANKTPPTLTAPTGWTKINERLGTNVRTISYQMAVTTTVPSSTTFTLSTSAKAVVGILSYAGADLVNPIDASSTTVTTSTTSHNTASSCPNLGDRRMLTVTGFSTATTATPPSNDTERVDQASPSANQSVAVEVADRAMPSDNSCQYVQIVTSASSTNSANMTFFIAPRANRTDELYGVARDEVLRMKPNGSVDLLLPDIGEIEQTVTGTPAINRYYELDGQQIIYRNPSVHGFITSNDQGSSQTTINYLDGAIQHTYYTPWGDVRTTAPTAPATDRRFLDKTQSTDNTLVNLNNRYYDPTTGQFLSVDPLVRVTEDPYLYTGGNPSTRSDPTGLDACKSLTCDPGQVPGGQHPGDMPNTLPLDGLSQDNWFTTVDLSANEWFKKHIGNDAADARGWAVANHHRAAQAAPGEIAVGAGIAAGLTCLFGGCEALLGAAGVVGTAGPVVLEATDQLSNSGVSAEIAGLGAEALPQILVNQAAGNAFRDLTAASLTDSGWELVGTEVRVNTPLGVRVVDILAEKDGEMFGFETKLGTSRYLAEQIAKDNYINRFGGTLSDGSRIQFPTVLVRGG